VTSINQAYVYLNLLVHLSRNCGKSSLQAGMIIDEATQSTMM